MSQSCQSRDIEPLEGWLSVNNNQRYCRLDNGRLDVASDEKLEKIEYSIPITKIVDTVHSHSDEFDLLPENSPRLHFASDDVDAIQKWKSAIIDDNEFNDLHQNSIKMSNFKICKTIGEGLSSQVSLVKRKTDGKLFALKQINKTKLKDSFSIQRMITERNIFIQNNYPFITKLYSAFQTDSHLVLVLEFVGGGDLQHHLDKGIMFSSKQIKIYLAEIALTIDHLHKMGIVFRDLKPSNILIAKDGHLKITDFGLAKNIIETGKTKSLCGTHEYLSPEMILSLPYDFSVDWWSLGIIAYRLICGILPFTNQNLSRLYDKIISCKYKLPQRIDEKERDFISKLLKKEITERMTFKEIQNHPYFEDIEWEKIYRKEYELDFIPFETEDENAYNFDCYLFDKSQTNSNSNNNNDLFDDNIDINNENEKSFIEGFSFSSNNIL